MATTTYKQPKATPGVNPYGATKLEELDVCVGNIDKSNQTEGVKTSGIKIRGTGAATKGITARGPMA